jgi:hypothetical protein
LGGNRIFVAGGLRKLDDSPAEDFFGAFIIDQTSGDVTELPSMSGSQNGARLFAACGRIRRYIMSLLTTCLLY